MRIIICILHLCCHAFAFSVRCLSCCAFILLLDVWVPSRVPPFMWCRIQWLDPWKSNSTSPFPSCWMENSAMVFAWSNFGPLPLSCWAFCVNEKNIGVDIPAWGPSTPPAGGGQNLFRTWASRAVLFHCFLFSFLCFISSVVLVRTGGDFGLISNLLHVPDVEVPADSYASLFQTLSETFGEMSCPSPSSHCDGGARGGARDSQAKLRPCKWLFRLVQNQMKQRVGKWSALRPQTE